MRRSITLSSLLFILSSILVFHVVHSSGASEVDRDDEQEGRVQLLPESSYKQQKEHHTNEENMMTKHTIVSRDLTADDTLQTCLDNLITMCPEKDGTDGILSLLINKADEPSVPKTKATAKTTLSYLTKRKRVTSIERKMNQVYDELATNVKSLEERKIRKKAEDNAIVLQLLDDQLFPRIRLAMDIVQYYMDIALTSNNSTSSSSSTETELPDLACTVVVDTKKNKRTQRSDAIRSMKLTSASILQKTLKFGDVGSMQVGIIPLILEIVFLFISVIVTFTQTILATIFQIVFNLPQFIIEVVLIWIDIILQLLLGGTSGGLREILSLSSSITDGSLTKRIIDQQLDQCMSDSATTETTTATVLGSDSKLLEKLISSTDTTLSFLFEQLSYMQNTVSYEIFMCEYKLALCQ